MGTRMNQGEPANESSGSLQQGPGLAIASDVLPECRCAGALDQDNTAAECYGAWKKRAVLVSCKDGEGQPIQGAEIQ